ncbi:MAG: hypothetical protein Q9220_004683 [cf. Caloplaca sp. 1 TL-2023]
MPDPGPPEPVVKAQDRPESPSILAQSTKGATFLILLQIGSRALTFLVNQILLRYLSPELLGLSTQLELYSSSVLFFARESLRVALQRQENEPFEAARGQKQDFRCRKIQEVVNLSYIAIGLGLPLATFFSSLYVHNADVLVLETPAFKDSLNLYMLATILELLSEPCFAVTQQEMLYGLRASAETLATLVRCLLTCGTAIWASKVHANLGALPFAVGQIGYAIVLNIVYLARIHSSSSNKTYSLLIHSISPSSPSLLYDRFSLPRLSLAVNIYAQSIFKHLLTTGDAFLVAAFTSLQTQGAYTLAANYGGLVARMMFQPIEESSRTLFSRLLYQTPSPNGVISQQSGNLGSEQKQQADQAAMYLQRLLRLYLLISLIAVAIGPAFSPHILRFIAGSRWSNSEAPAVLAAYCYYIPLLAVNGILEAFVSAVASPAQLRTQSAWMLACSAAFVGSGYLMLKVLDQGAKGLVYANSVNMVCRILWSWHFVDDYLRLRGVKLDRMDVSPRTGTVLGGLITAWYLDRIKCMLWQDGWYLARGLTSAGCYGLTMLSFEWNFLADCYRMLRAPAADAKRKTL